jgi:hypothetical protein
MDWVALLHAGGGHTHTQTHTHTHTHNKHTHVRVGHLPHRAVLRQTLIIKFYCSENTDKTNRFDSDLLKGKTNKNTYIKKRVEKQKPFKTEACYSVRRHTRTLIPRVNLLLLCLLVPGTKTPRQPVLCMSVLDAVGEALRRRPERRKEGRRRGGGLNPSDEVLKHKLSKRLSGKG